MNLQPYWYWLTNIQGLSNRAIGKIMDYYQTPNMLYEESAANIRLVLTKYCQLKSETVEAVIRREPTDYYNHLIQQLVSKGIKIVTLSDCDYPKKLIHIYDSPYLLYYQGSLPNQQKPMIGIVGARRCSAYGAHMATTLAKSLSKSGFNIISGMARGIDSLAHKGAFEGADADSGVITIGVLGSGVNVCYPKENQQLYEQLIQKGCVLSEYPIDTQPYPGNFPLRNRIISGMADGVVVIEAKKKSGSLITAHYGLDQGKDIYAVPGRVTDPLSEGCNELIRAGAKMVLDAQDILEDYGIGPLQEQQILKVDALNTEEATIYKQVSFDPVSVEHLCNCLNIKVEEIALSIIGLEIKGLIRHLPNNYIVRK